MWFIFATFIAPSVISTANNVPAMLYKDHLSKPLTVTLDSNPVFKEMQKAFWAITSVIPPIRAWMELEGYEFPMWLKDGVFGDKVQVIAHIRKQPSGALDKNLKVVFSAPEVHVRIMAWNKCKRKLDYWGEINYKMGGVARVYLNTKKNKFYARVSEIDRRSDLANLKIGPGIHIDGKYMDQFFDTFEKMAEFGINFLASDGYGGTLATGTKACDKMFGLPEAGSFGIPT